MNGAQAHLFTNHIPVLGVVFAAALTLAGLLRRSDELTRAGLWAFVLAGIGALPPYFSGESAEHVVEHLAGVSEKLIHAHQEAGEGALVAALVLAGLSLIALLFSFKSGRMRRDVATGLLVVSLPVLGWLIYTAHLGGLIHHEELRAGARAGAASPEDND